MFVFLFILGLTLIAIGVFGTYWYAVDAKWDIPLRQAFSELFDNDKFTVYVFCMVLGILILIYLRCCID